MTCLDGKKHVSFYMDITSERHAQDLSHCMLDYSSTPLKELRQFDKKKLESLYCCRKSKISDTKGDLQMTMKLTRPSNFYKNITQSNDALKDNLSQMEEHVGRTDESRMQFSPISTRTTRKSESQDTCSFPHRHSDADRYKWQNTTTFNIKIDTDANHLVSCNCHTIGNNSFHTTDTSRCKMTKFNYLKSSAPTDILQKSPGRHNCLQRRTSLVSDYDVMDNYETPMKTSPECNSTNDNRVHKLFLWVIINIRYILSSCRLRGEHLSTRTRKRNSISRKWTFWLLLTLLMMRADSKRLLGNSLFLSPGQFCMRPRYLSGKQHEICRNNSDILKFIKEGVIMGSNLCQKEFQLHRWNCSSAPKSYYSKLLQQDIRETAFITALTSAALTYRMTVACTKGDITNCGCLDEDNYIGSYDLLKAEAKKRHYKVNETELRRVAETFDWGGCHDQLEYGEYISTLFTENFGRKYESFDLKGKIEKHNMESGRKAVSSQMRETCRCHGITGSCALRTCWKTLPPWSDVKNHLRNKFDSAIRVQLENDGRSLRPTRKQRLAIREYPPVYKLPADSASSRSPRSFQTIRHRRRRKSSKSRRKNARRHRNGFDKPFLVADDDLVYSQESPNFCKKVRKHGTLGTSGRRCIPNTIGAGSCAYLCCGRGTTQRTENVTERCHCRLQQSTATVHCDNCTKEKIFHYCN